MNNQSFYSGDDLYYTSHHSVGSFHYISGLTNADDTGLVDKDGNAILVVRPVRTIGFVRDTDIDG